jgi:hypothetical protein
MLRSFSQLASQPGGINRGPTVWLNGARPLPSTFSKIMLVQQAPKFDQLEPYLPKERNTRMLLLGIRDQVHNTSFSS